MTRSCARSAARAGLRLGRARAAVDGAARVALAAVDVSAGAIDATRVVTLDTGRVLAVVALLTITEAPFPAVQLLRLPLERAGVAARPLAARRTLERLGPEELAAAVVPLTRCRLVAVPRLLRPGGAVHWASEHVAAAPGHARRRDSMPP